MEYVLKQSFLDKPWDPNKLITSSMEREDENNELLNLTCFTVC